MHVYIYKLVAGFWVTPTNHVCIIILLFNTKQLT